MLNARGSNSASNTKIPAQVSHCVSSIASVNPIARSSAPFAAMTLRASSRPVARTHPLPDRNFR